LLLVSATADGQADLAKRPPSTDPVYFLIRSDDGGMSHSVNMALERLIETGLPVSVSVMFACPWYQETVEMLKRHPAVAVGIHLTLNSEWKNYRWGPVSGRGTVPTLVDTEGYFFPTAEALYQHHPDLKEVETELRASLGAQDRLRGLPHGHRGPVSRVP
jgi:chitin disaccharide deacetylase